MRDKYTKIELIGSGTFGRVWLVLEEKTHRKYAIKEIQVSSMSGHDKEQALTEVSALGRCKHVNIIRYKEAFVDRGMLNIAMEYADGGDLHIQIKQQKGVYFAEQLVLDWYTQVCFGLRYIHGRNILHRDLKTQNIFLTNTGTIKIGDFGIAKILQDTSDHARTAIGTPYYLSPEICQRKPYNHKSDMWASGCVLYELTCLAHPFDGMNFSDLVLKIMQGDYKYIPSHYSALVEDLISILLRVDASKRPSARQILCIPGMQSNVDAYVHRMHHLHVNVCNSLASKNILEKRKNPDAEKGKYYFTDDEKENVTPERSTFIPLKRPRKHSMSTPKPEDVIRDRRSSSAESSNQVTKQNRMSVKNSPKYSLYMDIINKRREQSPLASLLLKPKGDIPVRDMAKQEPRFSLCEFVNSEQAKKKTPSSASQPSQESVESTVSQPLRESTPSTVSQSLREPPRAQSTAVQCPRESTRAQSSAGQSSAEVMLSAEKKQRKDSVDDSVLHDRKHVSISVPNLPKAVSESLERVDKEFEAIKERVGSLRKASLGDLRAARERADRKASLGNLRAARERADSQTETGDGASDGERDAEQPEKPKRSGSQESMERYKNAQKIPEADEKAPNGATDSGNMGNIELSKELYQLGRRDSAGSRYTPDSITKSRADCPTEAKSSIPNDSTSGLMVGEKDKEMEVKLREIGRKPRTGSSRSDKGGCKKDSRPRERTRTETGEKRSVEMAFGSGKPKVCGKTYKVDMSSSIAGSAGGSMTYDLDKSGNETDSNAPTLPTVIFRIEIPKPPAISPSEVTSILHRHAITNSNSILHQAESLRYLLETKMGCENFMTAYQTLNDALKSGTPVEEFSAVFASYMSYHPLIFCLIQLEAASECK